MATTDPEESNIDRLLKKHGLTAEAIQRARSESDKNMLAIRNALSNPKIKLGEDVSLVVYGSLARGEWTSGSDIDWTLLIDGPVDPEHYALVKLIREALEEAGHKEPGATGTFGSMTFAHELVHLIGGVSDTNQNLTRRVLLLSESRAVLNPLVHMRVVRAILNRYIVWGRGLPSGDGRLRAPRFLLNDVVRLWRTMAVDYAAKKWERGDEGWALRNAKLRMSRKLTFVKGLLLCLDCEAFPGQGLWSCEVATRDKSDDAVNKRLVAGCADLVEKTPLELLARALLLADAGEQVVSDIVSSYNLYLELMNDSGRRNELEELSFPDATNNETFRRIREEISKPFQAGLVSLFFDSDSFRKLTRDYGIF